MPEMSPGAALRQLHQAQAGLRKARQVLRLSRTDPNATAGAIKVGWEALGNSHRVLAGIPLAAADEAVMTKQLAVERYSTALLVRLRRLLRHEPVDFEGFESGDDDESD